VPKGFRRSNLLQQVAEKCGSLRGRSFSYDITARQHTGLQPLEELPVLFETVDDATGLFHQFHINLNIDIVSDHSSHIGHSEILAV
jgi:hypothetical protein